LLAWLRCAVIARAKLNIVHAGSQLVALAAAVALVICLNVDIRQCEAVGRAFDHVLRQIFGPVAKHRSLNPLGWPISVLAPLTVVDGQRHV
jgi:hypothetical protein